MTLEPGAKLGPYEITALLGAGGMGEVWKARDARLGREVAVKVLPEEVFEDKERVARFEREAKLLAALNHPGIAAVYSFEEIPGSPGSTGSSGRHLLVMELLEGETLRERLRAGPLSPRKAIDVAAQIALALAAAHEKGIVHRDLKPENVFLTNGSRVKILDFGLAKLSRREEAVEKLTEAGTLSLLTEAGAVFGTVGYMSPEQVRGEPADHRTDIFSFGTVLYEMLSGKNPFLAATTAETMTAILKEEPPPFPEKTVGIAPALSSVVGHCLEKKPEARFQSSADLAFALLSLSSSPAAPIPRRRWSGVAAAVLVAVVALALGFAAFKRKAPGPGPVVRFSVPPPEKATFERNVVVGSFAPSPDGRRIAFMANAGGRAVLWLWSVADEAAIQLPDTDGAISPFWSPDGLSVAFFADGKLKKVAVSGGPAQVLTDAPFGQAGSWSANGVILFSEWSGEGIYRVPAEGGTATKLTFADGEAATRSRAWPSFLPDGTHFLYMTGMFRGPAAQDYRVCVGQLGSPEATCLMQSDTRAEYVPPGRLLFVRKGTLLAQPFDAARRRVSGEPAAIADRISVFVPTGGAEFAASADGRLIAYRHGGQASRLVWMDRSGRQVGSVGQPGYFGLVRISPDERRLAVDVEDPATGGRDIWLYDLLTGIGSRLTFDTVDAGNPVWSPDGSQLMFGSAAKGPPHIYVKDLGGQLEEKLAFAAPGAQFPCDWTRDGRFVAYWEYSPSRKARQVLLLPMTGERKPLPLVGGTFHQYDARFSSDSRSIAFVSEESGQAEVYVAAVDGTGQKQRVSPAGGSLPCWSQDGKELFFVSADNDLMTVAVSPGQDLRFSAPKPLFSLPPFPFRFRSDYDVSRDGQRFLINLGTERAPQPPLTVILGWQQQLGSDRPGK